MSLFAPADVSAGGAQARENREGIAAHKYEGLTTCQRTVPSVEERLRRFRGLRGSYGKRQRLRRWKWRQSLMRERLISGLEMSR
jgi:hypothetical protein